MTIDDIHAMQEQYVQVVVNAKSAGFDAVTFHAAHGNIMPEFFSTLYNKRTNWYGGSLENRVRFAREIVEMARKAVGPAYPLIMRISGDEYIEGGRTLDETVEICRILEKAGIDCFDVSGGIQASYIFSIAPYNLPGLHGFMMPSAKAIKEAVNVPVIGVGGVRDPELAEKFLEEGYADMIALGRSFIADPDFGVKAMEGRSADIRPCLACGNCFNEICCDRILTCTVNPETGREDDFKDIEEAKEKKKVLVVGGGATGCESAEFFGAQEYELKVHRLKNFAGDLDITVTHNDKFHNKDVTIVEMMPELGIGMGDFEKRILFATLKENGVKSMVNTKVWNIDDGVVRVVDKNRGDVVELPADTVILAGGLRPTCIDTSNVTIPVYSIGDADRPGRIINALFQAYCTAREF